MRTAFAFIAAGMVMHCVIAKADEAAAWRAASEKVLMPALRDAYPDVTHWTLTALLGKRQQTRLQDVAPDLASIVRVGARSAVRLSWSDVGKTLHSTIWFAVEGMQELPTAKSAIRAGSSLAPQLVARETRNVVALACTPIPDAQALIGMRARQSVQAGQVICAQFIEPRPPVTRGEDVVVKSVAGAVTVIAKGVAQQDGSLGQVLRIRNPANGATYLAAVSAEGEVVVHE